MCSLLSGVRDLAQFDDWSSTCWESGVSFRVYQTVSQSSSRNPKTPKPESSNPKLKLKLNTDPNPETIELSRRS